MRDDNTKLMRLPEITLEARARQACAIPAALLGDVGNSNRATIESSAAIFKKLITANKGKR